MKKVTLLSVLVALICLIISSAAISEPGLPSLDEVFGKVMPSISTVLNREADTVNLTADGSLVCTYENVTEDDYENISMYFDKCGCTLGDYEIANSIITANIVKDDVSIVFEYDLIFSKASVRYTQGTREEQYVLLIPSSTPTATPKPTNTPKPQLQVGTQVTFGKYQGENIVWKVLEIKDNQALLLSANALDRKQYHNTCQWISWENCSLRSWLNNEFIYNAFTKEQQNKIVNTIVPTSKNKTHNTDSGIAVTDEVFILSLEEINHYRRYIDMACGVNKYIQEKYYEYYGWWIRTPGNSKAEALSGWIYRDGVDDGDYMIDDVYGTMVSVSYMCVRPAMWVEISAIENSLVK